MTAAVILQYVAYLLFLFIFIQRVRRGESLIGIVLTASLVLPDIYGIEITNVILFMIIGAAWIVVRKKQKIVVSQEVLLYVAAYGGMLLWQFIAWSLHNRADLLSELRSSFAVLKYPLLIVALYIYDVQREGKRRECEKEIYRTITIMNILNVIACIVQKANKDLALKFFGSWCSYSAFHMEELSNASKYYRAYGLWESAMSLGIYALISVAFLFYCGDIRKKQINWYLNLGMSLLLGIVSLTKTFFLGMVVLLIMESMIYFGAFLSKIREKRMEKRDVFGIVGVLLGGIVLTIGIQSVYEWSTSGWTYLHYYLGFLYDPLRAFSTRLSPDGTLWDTIKVIQEHWLMGVGLIPVGQEFVGDNAYAVLLHAGGIVAFLVIVGMYVWWMIRCVQSSQTKMAIVLLIWLLCGFSLPIFIAYKICLIPVSLYLFTKGANGDEKNTYDGETSGCRWSRDIYHWNVSIYR